MENKSKHAKRRANKKAQKDAGPTTGSAPTDDKNRDQQIKELEYAPGETKSNEDMVSEEPAAQIEE